MHELIAFYKVLLVLFALHLHRISRKLFDSVFNFVLTLLLMVFNLLKNSFKIKYLPTLL